MHKNLILSLALIFTLLAGHAPVYGSTVQMEVLHSLDQYPAGGRYPILIRLRISGTWSIHGPQAGEDELIPTVFTFSEDPDLLVVDLRFPAPERRTLEFLNEPIDVYSGETLIAATLVVDERAEVGTKNIDVNLSYQACSNDACLPPEKVSLTVPFVIAQQGARTAKLNEDLFLAQQKGQEEVETPLGLKGEGGLALTLLLIFLGGLALNLTPCIYPLIPITVSYFGGRSGTFRGHPLFNSAFYMAGLALTNSLLGVSAALSGRLLGSTLQNPIVLILVAAILFSLGLSFLGLWEFRLPAGLSRLAGRNYYGYFGSFFMGLTLGILAAPCLGPFILGLLTYVGQKGDPLLGFLYFFVLSLGLGLPLSVLAFFSGASKKLPVSGDWMVWVRKLMGWVLMGMAAYILIPLFSSDQTRVFLLGGIGFLAGIHLGWIDRTGKTIKRFLLVKRGMGLLLIGTAVLYGLWTLPQREGIPWIPYDPQVMTRTAKENRPLILDFYADWCSPCKAMDRSVFRDAEVLELSRFITFMRLDLTQRHPSQEEVLKHYRVKGVPTLIFFKNDGQEEPSLRIECYVDTKHFLARAKRLLEEPSG